MSIIRRSESRVFDCQEFGIVELLQVVLPFEDGEGNQQGVGPLVVGEFESAHREGHVGQECHEERLHDGYGYEVALGVVSLDAERDAEEIEEDPLGPVFKRMRGRKGGVRKLEKAFYVEERGGKIF